METKEQKQFGNSVQETHKLNFYNDEELIKRERVEGTPFTLKWEKEKGWQLGLAEYALTTFKETKEETLEILERNRLDWDLIITIIGSLIDLMGKEQAKQLVKELKGNKDDK